MQRLLMLLLAGLFLAGAAQALTPEQARAIAAGDTDARIAALNEAAGRGAPGLAAFVQALLDDGVKLTPQQVLVFDGEKTVDAATGQPVATLPEDAEDAVNNNRMRGALQAALAALRLASPDLAARREAVAALAKQSLDESQLSLLDRALAAESDAGLKARLMLMRASLLVASPDPAKRLAAARQLASSGEPTVKSLLLERLAHESDAEVKSALSQALSQVERRLAWGERGGLLFTGISLGSILLLVALGLAITYGLMGVINMAHGELMMIGAYATYLVQNAFKAWLPAGLFDYYVLLAIPASFLVAAAVGAVLERGVIRWLYGRPLETLLATWGISLVLMQAVRSLFGAQNVPVENPAWLSGGVAVMSNLILPYNRIAIIVFAFAVLAGVALLIARTRLGLFVRGVTQNRRMAACMGVNTARIDTYAFALGAGIAGLAGCALSQVGNVGPDLGQGYIVDSFMVVVLGGVGQLAGTVIAALGLGVLNKLLEDWAGAVLAKIMVLVFIVVFIQKRPQGLFAMKGRSAEA
ncbi:urea ABC transporter permease subunit UrtB [Roseateles sp. DAIF2]|uniref:urea ABC transporter permease subunit UrtB n=1 Tax=Roseateles sp. DAIF2 TaxID=2714952 RepID=UPI0018A2B635|nr:urea ABC transporter permease subunit UrtB [Roseateles sp. DAIF2]QPF75197.1 urea ABC transporter permease subunit UrtB [Roseateles sp. DAIF2]